MLDKSKRIDINTWKRRDYFYYFTKIMPTNFSMTVDIDVTNTYEYVKNNNYKFFPTYLYLGTQAVIEEENFKLGFNNDELVRYELLHPSYSIFHKDDHSISNMWTIYDNSFIEFYKNYENDMLNYADKKGAIVKKEEPPKNTLMIGTIPWVSFNSYTPTILKESKQLTPIIQSGKFKKSDGKVLMPVSITINHAVGDGYHVSRLFNNLQEKFNKPVLYLK